MNARNVLKACAAILLFSCVMTPPSRAATFGLFTYTDDGASITITDYDGSTPGPVTIPAKIGGKPVTVIGGYAFAYHNLVTSVAIPASVTFIGNYAFYYCNIMTSVSGGAGVKTIGTSAFGGCTSLTGFSIPQKVSYVGGGAFSGCNGLTSLTIPPSVTFIGEHAFESCSKLTSVTIPNSVTSLGNSAFAVCSGLTSMTIPSSITNIGDSTFYKCTGLLSVSIPSTVTSIGSSAFSNCTGLTTVVLPSSLTYIGDEAFEFCTGLAGITIPAIVNHIGLEAFRLCNVLTSAHFLGNAPAFGTKVFDGAAAGFTLYYLNGSTGFTSPTWNGYPAVMLSLPEIAVEQPLRTSLIDGAAKINFGDVEFGSSGNAFTFKLKNTGTAPLTGLAITVTGGKKSFLVTPLTKTSLSPGGKMTFDVTFTPSTTGKITADLVIANDDADENPFNIKLTGKGVAGTPAPSAVAESAASLAWSDALGSVCVPKLATGTSPSHQATVTTVELSGGRRYLALVVAKAPGTEHLTRTVEVSSNLVDWCSGRNHTTVMEDDASFLKVRDNTPLAPGTKRYIRLAP